MLGRVSHFSIGSKGARDDVAWRETGNQLTQTTNMAGAGNLLVDRV